MTEPDVKPTDQEPTDNPQKPQAPADPQAGQAKPEGEELPEKFRGKSAADIAKSYSELEKKLGEYKDYGSTKEKLASHEKQLQQFYTLANVINGNPELKAAVVKAAGGEAENPDKPKIDNTTIAVRNETISTFQKDLGIQALPEGERTPLLDNVMRELKDMFDHEGTMSNQQVLDAIPLPKLKVYLHKAYRLATADNDKEQSRLKGILEARKNSEAVFGSISSSGVKQSKGLTPKEQEIARRMGISEEKYLKNKEALEAEQTYG